MFKQLNDIKKLYQKTKAKAIFFNKILKQEEILWILIN